MRYAPSSDLVENKKAKSITFKRQNGHIMLYMGERHVGGGRMVHSRLNEMKSEVDKAVKGHTVTTMKQFGSSGVQFARHGVQSTFPKWYGQHGFKNKLDFAKTLKNKQSVRNKRLVNQAIDDLSKGYDSSHGRVPPSEKFQVKTRQKFDNRNVIFRRIRGRIVPMRINDEVPF